MSAKLGPTKDLPPGRYGLSGLLRSEWTKLRVAPLDDVDARHDGISRNRHKRAGHCRDVGPIRLRPGLELRPDRHEPYRGVRRAADHWRPRRDGDDRGVRIRHDQGDILRRTARTALVPLAKATVFGFVALVVAEVVSFLSYFLGQALLSVPADPLDNLQSGGAAGSCRRRPVPLPDRTFRVRARDVSSGTRRELSALSSESSSSDRSSSVRCPPLSPTRSRSSCPITSGRASCPSTWERKHSNPGQVSWSLFGYAVALMVIGGVLLVRRDAWSRSAQDVT